MACVFVTMLILLGTIHNPYGLFVFWPFFWTFGTIRVTLIEYLVKVWVFWKPPSPLPVLMVCEWPRPYISWHLGQYCRYDLRNNDTGGCDGLHAFLGPDNRRSIQCHYYYFNRPLCRLFSPYRTCFPVRSRCYYISTLDVFFCQITTFIKVCAAFVFWLQNL